MIPQLDEAVRVQLATHDYLQYHGIIPIVATSDSLLIATWKPTLDPQLLDEIRLAFNVDPQLVQYPEEAVRAAIERVYAGESHSANHIVAALAADDETTTDAVPPVDDLRALANDAPVVRFVNALLIEAIQAGASDVHLEMMAERLDVRLRLDGVLQDAPAPPRNLGAAIVSRVKIMAELDIAERRLPQDGRIRLRLDGGFVDVRVATLPALHGESVVLRILDKRRSQPVLEDLGMVPDTFGEFKALIERPHGLVLVTGPTGSGKTTTLYAALQHIRTGHQKIVTVEDPVEYEMPGAVQVSVNTKIGLTFAAALRALLRQDPDILLIGEIRDSETAAIATHAALTGHLVLATLHTNDAASAVTRLVDLGVPPFLVATTLHGVLAQRLVRRICTACRVEHAPDNGTVAQLHTTPEQLPRVATGTGCPACRDTGYAGRLPIFELLVLGSSERQVVNDATRLPDFARYAAETGIRTLREDGLRAVRLGLTTPAEVIRATA